MHASVRCTVSATTVTPVPTAEDWNHRVWHVGYVLVDTKVDLGEVAPGQVSSLCVNVKHLALTTLLEMLKTDCSGKTRLALHTSSSTRAGKRQYHHHHHYCMLNKCANVTCMSVRDSYVKQP